MIEDKEWTVYKHTAPNGKVYIGITGQNPEKRWNNGYGYIQNKHFYRAIRSYKWENFKHDILETGLTKEQACNREIELIAKYDSANPDKGYNNSTGGEYSALGVHRSAETRRKMSEAMKGANSPWYGKHYSVEERRKMSESHKGKTPSNIKAVICVETGTLYSSITEAAESIGLTKWAISNAVRGVQKTAGGYHWKYVEEQSLERQTHDKL